MVLKILFKNSDYIILNNVINISCLMRRKYCHYYLHCKYLINNIEYNKVFPIDDIVCYQILR